MPSDLENLKAEADALYMSIHPQMRAFLMSVLEVAADENYPELEEGIEQVVTNLADQAIANALESTPEIDDLHPEIAAIGRQTYREIAILHLMKGLAVVPGFASLFPAHVAEHIQKFVLEAPFVVLNAAEKTSNNIPNEVELIRDCPPKFHDNGNKWVQLAIQVAQVGLTQERQAKFRFKVTTNEIKNAKVDYFGAWLRNFSHDHETKMAVAGWLLSLMLAEYPQQDQ